MLGVEKAPQELIEQVQTKAQGNPFLIQEIIESLRGANAIEVNSEFNAFHSA